MKKSLIKLSAIISLIILAGICYSCTYWSGNSSKAVILSLDDASKDSSDENHQNHSEDFTEEAMEAKKQSGDEDITLKEQGIYIHICGAVHAPGVYQMAVNTRLVDLIEMAGGLTEDAAGDYLNQARMVSDGERIYVPTKDELESLSVLDFVKGDQANNKEASQSNSLININKANKETLMALPGIGQAKADRIIEYRNSNGDFKSIEELMNIPGIKEGLFHQISSYITIN